MKVLLHDNAISERGTTNALIAYSRILKNMGHDVGIGFYEKHKANNKSAIKSLDSEFELFPYKNFQRFTRKHSGNWNSAYWIKSGHDDKKVLEGTWNAVHAVFQVYEPHGDSYFYVSRWLADEMRLKFEGTKYVENGLIQGTSNAARFEYLPHVIELPPNIPKNSSDVRVKFGIPKNSTVGVRYGGYETFDLKIAQSAVLKSLAINPDLHFIFVNTLKFTSHPRVHFLPAILDEQAKVDLLFASDFFIHGRLRGESFGLSIGEALYCGLPTFVWTGGEDRNHLSMVPTQFWYQNEQELCNLIELSKSKARIESQSVLEEFKPTAIRRKLSEFLRLGPNENQ